jgi:D-cysteine desulfhydrase
VTEAFPEPVYPTPLRRLPELSGEGAEVWLKDDGWTHAVYGGNKVRKVHALVRAAEADGARRLLTFGAGGSHHVLTTALFARAHKLAYAALLTPQPRSRHAVDTLRAALAAGLEAFPAPTNLATPVALARAFRVGDVVIPPGGSNVLGASEYAGALGELKRQLEGLGEGPPDLVVVPLGTGGTAAGLFAGTALHGLPTTVLAVSILRNPFDRFIVERLARAIVRRRGGDPATLSRRQLRLDGDFVGDGYGHATLEGDAATARLAGIGLELDQTYTAKAMACLLALVRRLGQSRPARPLKVVYWHTLSAAPLAPLLANAGALEDMPRGLQRLFF